LFFFIIKKLFYTNEAKNIQKLFHSQNKYFSKLRVKLIIDNNSSLDFQT